MVDVRQVKKRLDLLREFLVCRLQDFSGFIQPEVESLSDYLGRDLIALWGYDRLG